MVALHNGFHEQLEQENGPGHRKLLPIKSYLLRVWPMGPVWQAQQCATLISVESGEQHHFGDLAALVDFLMGQEQGTKPEEAAMT